MQASQACATAIFPFTVRGSVPFTAANPETGMDTIAVLIPCFNEAQTIDKVVTAYREALPEATIYVYDNNSTDGTAERAAAAGAVVRHEYRQGKGIVVRTMLREIDAACYLLTDGDDTYPAEAARTLCAPVLEGRCDMVIGDRLSSTYFTQNRRPFHNTGNRIVLRAIRSLWQRKGGSKVTDVMTGMRALSPLLAKSFPALENGFELETELTIFALESRMRVLSQPVDYRDRPCGSVSKLSTFRDGMKILKTIFRLYTSHRPLQTFGAAAMLLALLSLGLFLPVLREYLHTGLVPRLPTLVVSGFTMLAALLSLSAGLVLECISSSTRQQREGMLNLLALQLRQATNRTDREGRKS